MMLPKKKTSFMQNTKRIIIKIGGALVADKEGHARLGWMKTVAQDIAAWRKKGREVMIVTSGAMALGREHIGLSLKNFKRPLYMEEKQAAAAAGQPKLMQAWTEAFKDQNIEVAQILLTLDDTEDRERHLTCRGAIEQLLKLGVVPVINENDTVSTAEIRIGDNDRLAARVAQMMSADTLILLSDIDGLYTANPKLDPSAAFLPEVKDITPEIEAMAGPPLAGNSNGGMRTKVMAAKIATAAGCRMAILRGDSEHPLHKLESGEQRCTWFAASTTPLAARKRWIAAHMKMKGSLSVDEGAAKALRSGKSLLPAGVKACEGAFNAGDAVAIKTLDGEEVGCGLVSYNHTEALKIQGQKSDQIEALLGYSGPEEIIHRDNMVLK